MEQHKRFLQKGTILLIILLAISCGKKEVWEQQNLQIIQDVLTHQCTRLDSVGKAHNIPKKSRKILLKDRYDNNVWDSWKNKRLKELFENKFPNKEHLSKYLFSNANIKYYSNQLEVTKNISYINRVIREDPCIKKSPKWNKGTNIPFLCNWRCFSISKVVFTKNNQYALFFSSTISSFGLSIFKNEKDTFVPFLSVHLATY